jgi:uncharacterized protein
VYIVNNIFEEEPMPNPIGHFEIGVSNLDAAMSFYKELFGWDIEFNPQMNYAMIRTGGKPDGGMFRIDDGMRPYVTIYPEVEDIDATLEKAEKLGGAITVKKTKISDEFGYFGMFIDLDGNPIGVWSKK